MRDKKRVPHFSHLPARSSPLSTCVRFGAPIAWPELLLCAQEPCWQRHHRVPQAPQPARAYFDAALNGTHCRSKWYDHHEVGSQLPSLSAPAAALLGFDDSIGKFWCATVASIPIFVYCRPPTQLPTAYYLNCLNCLNCLLPKLPTAYCLQYTAYYLTANWRLPQQLPATNHLLLCTTPDDSLAKAGLPKPEAHDADGMRSEAQTYGYSMLR
jgi:hypothetical protein